jgi:hypothetical protein
LQCRRRHPLTRGTDLIIAGARCAETQLCIAGSWSFPASSRWRADCAIVIEQRYRALLPDCPVGPFFVTVSAPILHLFLRVGKAQEPVGVQALRTEAAIEGPNEGIVGRLSWAGEVERDTVLISPQIQIS